MRSVSSAVDQRSTSPSPRSRRYEVPRVLCILFSSLFWNGCMIKQYMEGKKAQQEDRGDQVNRYPRCAKARESYPSMVSSGNTSPTNGHNDPLGRGVSGITMM